ncbi:hypothetical protein GUITHDRAFT_136078 [Guillardia theta CCMP2712]|uniref:Protein HIRA n=3 Tax=Guillardia theta TaxID=55529 RepID=L1JMI6_GUITC|nr:hypothetical protein GUITHDRAFT_136078 [Guillardia theta CCMP2712]EKX49410.1 hypothetical protein GUITHDRAFT_136078 [Guillardia theta CCMP2712]|eukprot:XP_005836390.1 hypothetical protein GUITHDRAFT_136078 [Guillardia theta CCMP2712]
MLSSCNHHTEAVNCVRWSPCGRFLASCAGDKTVLVLHLGYTYANPIKTLGNKNLSYEEWIVRHSFRGHELDVLHVAWCPNGTRLASCGLDNYVFVWDLHGNVPVAKLRENGMVKGVSWDPIGKYLAAQVIGGEEKSTVVWRVRDWQKEVKNTAGYIEAPDEPMFLRLSWSPDGQNLATVNAFISNKYTCALLKRDGGKDDDARWERDATMQGWSAPVTVASFHPQLLKRNNKIDAVCAMGSQKSEFTIWSANGQGKPLTIIKELFDQEIYDISWGGENSYILTACSHDGTVAVIFFSAKEIGSLVLADEKQKILRKYYGDQTANSGELDLPEDLAQLNFEKSRQTEAKTVNTVSVSEMKETVVRSKQEETRTSGGKRRICPKVVQPSIVEISPVQNSLPASQPMQNGSTSSSLPVSAGTTVASSSTNSHTTVQPQKASSSQENGLPAISENSTASQKQSTNSLSLTSPNPTTESSNPSNTEAIQNENSSTTSVSTSDSKKRKAASGAKGDGTRDKRQALAGQLPSADNVINLPVQVLKPLKHKETITLQICSGSDSQIASNGLGSSSQGSLYLNCSRADDWSVVNCVKEDGAEVWRDYFKEHVTAVSANRRFSAVTCKESCLYVYSTKGRRMMPAIALSAQATCLQAGKGMEPFLGVLTCDGNIRVWDVVSQTETCSANIHAVLHEGVEVDNFWITGDGQPIVGMSDGQCYAYHKGMKCMVRIAESQFRSSEYFSHHRLSGEARGDEGHLRKALELASRGVKPQHLPAMIVMDPLQTSQITLAHVETLLAASMTLNSSSEFKYWLDLYVKYLIDKDLESRLRELCEMLLYQSFCLKDEPTGSTGTILGYKRQELVQDVLMLMRNKRSLQRCVEEVSLLLEVGTV